MITKEHWKKILKIFYLTRKPVEEIFSGEYRSAFKGQGIEFSEVREYVPGDDIRSINWKLTAKYNHPFIKKFEETRELSIIILIDLSRSMFFGSKKSKKEIQAEIASLLSWAAIVNGDKVGMLLFTDRVEKYIPPTKGRNQIMKLIREVISYEVETKNTDIKEALSYLNRMLKKRAVVFILSDFLSDFNYEKILKVTSKKHEVIPIQILDLWEEEINFKGNIFFEDSETGELYFLTREKIKHINDNMRKRIKKQQEFFKKINLDFIKVRTDRDYLNEILLFFKRRFKKR